MCVPVPSCGDTPGSVWLDRGRAVVWGWPKTLDARKRRLPELALAVLLAGKQLASDRKGSAIRGLSRAPKPTKKWRTWEGRKEGWVREVKLHTLFPTLCPIWGAPAWAEWGARE